MFSLSSSKDTELNKQLDGTEVAALQKSPRLICLDALRGFDMFWIIGAERIVSALPEESQSFFARLLRSQLDHADWIGFRFYDLIFPLFIFIVGLSIVFSLPKAIERGGKKAAFFRIARRAVMLYLFGLFYYGGISHGLENMRLLGVLQRISLCYLFASALFLIFNLRGLIISCITILAGYWAMMTFIPVPELGAGHFEKGANLANYVDSVFLPFRKYDGDWDPEGLLSTLPAIATCMLGIFTGLFVKNPKFTEQKKSCFIFAAGVLCILLGYLWSIQFPVIKKIWTSSFVLVAGGYSAILFAVFYQIIEIWKFQKWTIPFIWIGVNPITIYIAHSIIPFGSISERIVGGPIKAAFGIFGDLLIACCVFALSLILLRFLYQRKIFLRV